MFTKPSVNQIASTYQGNPAPLARKVDQDKKQNGGIPKDLRQMMALDDIAENKNSAGIAEALQIPTNMPTVAQSIQQRAQQAIQARMLQMAREQQRLQQKPPILPDGVPQPKDQPQGIDALRTNVGEEYAEGGIIGKVKHFTTGDQVVDPMGAVIQGTSTSDDDRTLLERLGVFNVANRRANEKLEKELQQREAAGLNKGDIQRGRLHDPRADQVRIPDIETQVKEAALASAAANAPQATGQATGGGAARAPSIMAALEKAGIINLPIDQTATKKLQGIMALDPDQQERLAQEKFKQQVGERDLSIYDKTAAELQARKEKLNAPKAGYDAMMEYLEQVALGGGRSSAESGALGASRQRQLQLARQGQQNEIMDKILELGAKKADAQYAAKEKLYQVGQERYKDVFKNAFEAAKDLKKSDDEARRLAQDAVLKQAELDNRLQTANIGAHDNLMSRAKALMAVDKTLTLDRAMERAAAIAATGQISAAEMRANSAADTTRAKIREKYSWIDMLPANDPTKKAMAAERDRALAAVGGGAGLPDAVTSAPTGKVKFVGYE